MAEQPAATTCPRCGADTTEAELTYSGCALCQREAAENAAQDAAAERAAALARDNCPTCGRLPFGRAKGPNPTKAYLCPYCNTTATLRDEGVVVDRFSNVCHEACIAETKVYVSPGLGGHHG